MQILSDDYSKVAMVCTDRTLLFQSKGTTYYKTRVPRFGRDLAYHMYTADLLVAASANELYRCSPPLENLDDAHGLGSVHDLHCLISKVLSPFDVYCKKMTRWIATGFAYEVFIAASAEFWLGWQVESGGGEVPGPPGVQLTSHQ